MKIALFGASGTIGQRILAEALSRGHTVTALGRDPSKVPTQEGVVAKQADVQDPKSVAQVVAGHDAVVSAVGPGFVDNGELVGAAKGLIAGLKQAEVKRLIVVGGAASLEVAPGALLLDNPAFPEAWKSVATGALHALNLYRQETELQWTFFSPAMMIAPGERTGKFRLGGDQLVVDAQGNSSISAEDYAVALVDELENPQHIRRRFTIAY